MVVSARRFKLNLVLFGNERNFSHLNEAMRYVRFCDLEALFRGNVSKCNVVVVSVDFIKYMDF